MANGSPWANVVFGIVSLTALVAITALTGCRQERNRAVLPPIEKPTQNFRIFDGEVMNTGKKMHRTFITPEYLYIGESHMLSRTFTQPCHMICSNIR